MANNVYIPFLIAVGQAGAYSDSMSYDKPFCTRESYGLWIKHIPFISYPQIKELTKQDWIDEQGEDVWLPTTGVMQSAFDMEVEFVYYAKDGMANERINAFIDRIKGKWLKVYDSYTRKGYRGVYLTEFGSEPTFRRRGLQDSVQFKVKFRVNDPATDVALD